MAICESCNGVIGRDCFNPRECYEITQQMKRDGDMPTLMEDNAILAEQFKVACERAEAWKAVAVRFAEGLAMVEKWASERRYRAAMNLDDPAVLTPYANTEGERFAYWRGMREGLSGINALAHDVLAGKSVQDINYVGMKSNTEVFAAFKATALELAERQVIR